MRYNLVVTASQFDMAYTLPIDKDNRIKAYLNALEVEVRNIKSKVSSGVPIKVLKDEAKRKAREHEKVRASSGNVRIWRKRVSGFLAKEDIILSVLWEPERRKKTKTTNRQPTEPTPTPSPTPSPYTEGAENNPKTQAAYPRTLFDEKTKDFQEYIKGQLMVKEVYSPADDTMIWITAKELATIEIYEEIRFSKGYEFYCPVRSEYVRERNPFEKDYWEALRQVGRHLQALGLNHDARDFLAKKKRKGILESYDADRRKGQTPSA